MKSVRRTGGYDKRRNESILRKTVPDTETVEKIKAISLIYSGSPFLTFTEIENGVTISAYHFKYFQNGVEIQEDELESILGSHHVEGAPNSGTSTAELGLFYVFEVIIILLGIVFIRYFLSNEKQKQPER